MLGAIPLAILGPLALTGIWTINDQGSVADVQRMAKQANLPTSIDEFFPKPSGDQSTNLATYLPAFHSQNTWQKEHKGFTWRPKGGWTDLTKLEEAVTGSQAAYKEIDTIKKCKEFKVARHGDFASVLFPEYADLKGTAQLLAARSHLRSSKGDLPGAIEDIQSIVDIGNLLGDDGVLIAVLVRIAIDNIAYVAAADLMPLASQDQAQSAKLLEAVRSSKPYNYYKAMRFESGMALMFATGPKVSLKSLGAVEDLDGEKFSYAQIAETRSIWAPALIKAHIAFLKEAEAEPIDTIKLLEANSRYFKPLADSSDPRMKGAKILAPMYSEAFRAGTSSYCRRKLVEIGLTALESGREPKVSGTVDLDSGKPYKVIKNESGWKVYGVGTDLKDDGGTVPEKDGPSDIVLGFDGKKVTLKGK
ncbi:MAG: hypothetical protein ABUL72_02395 [Armatimonadota bacterium]